MTQKLTDEQYARLGKNVERSNVLECLRVQTIALREYLAEAAKTKSPDAKINQERMVLVSTRLVIANQNAEHALLIFLNPNLKESLATPSEDLAASNKAISDLIDRDSKR